MNKWGGVGVGSNRLGLGSPISLLTDPGLLQMRAVGSPWPGALGVRDAVRSPPRQAAWHRRSCTLAATATSPHKADHLRPLRRPHYDLFMYVILNQKYWKVYIHGTENSHNPGHWSYNAKLPHLPSLIVYFNWCTSSAQRFSLSHEKSYFAHTERQEWWLKHTWSAHAYGCFATCYWLSLDFTSYSCESLVTWFLSENTRKPTVTEWSKSWCWRSSK